MRPSRQASIVLAVLLGAQFVNFLDRQAISALAPAIKTYWHLSDTQVGLLGTAFEVLYALAPVPIAILADRWLRRKVISLALVVWSGAMVISGGAASFGMLLLGRAALGLGEAGYGPSADAWLSDVFPPAYRSRAIGVHELGVIVGSAAGFALGGVLGQALGWRSVFFVAALPGFLLAGLVWRLPEPRKGQTDYQALGVAPDTVSLPTHSIVSAARELFSTPTHFVIYVVGTLVSFATNGLIYWVPSFAVRVHGFAPDRFGLLIAALTIVAGAAGVLSGGFAADRLMRRTPAGRLWGLGLSSLAAVALVLVAIAVPERTLFVMLAAPAMVLFAFYAPCMMPLIYQVTHPNLRATATAFYLFVVHILGYATAPTIIGWLSDRVGDLRLGMAIALSLGLVGGFVALWGTRFVGRDEQAVVDRLRAETQR